MSPRALLGAWLALTLAASAQAGDPAGLPRALALETDPEPLPAYHLAIEPKPLRRLMLFREQLLESGPMSPDERLWVPATLFADGQRLPARLRLRGPGGERTVAWAGAGEPLWMSGPTARVFEGETRL